MNQQERNMLLLFDLASPSPTPPPGQGYILLENGGRILLENGLSALLLESNE